MGSQERLKFIHSIELYVQLRKQHKAISKQIKSLEKELSEFIALGDCVRIGDECVYHTLVDKPCFMSAKLREDDKELWEKYVEVKTGDYIRVLNTARGRDRYTKYTNYKDYIS